MVEMSVIVVLVGMVASAAVIPMLAQFENELYSREEQRMELVKAAVIGYAISHQTADGGITVEIQVPGDPDNLRRYEYPVAGRPYLPCPDITGDGYEDRIGFSREGLVYLTGTATTVVPIDGSMSRMVESGGCIGTRGVLPWRTLGVPPADVWGNLYTYQVDGIWADADVGFNQNSYIDIYDSRTVVTGTVGLFAASRLISQRTVYGISDSGYEIDPVEGPAGAAPIPFTRFSGSPGGFADPRLRQMPPLVICVSLPCDYRQRMELHPEGGKQSNGDLSVLYRRFVANDVTEGIPFAIVSHGRNGLGAVRYNNQVINTNSNNPNSGERSGLVCNRPAHRNRSTAGMVGPTVETPEAFNFPILSLANISSGFCSGISYDYPRTSPTSPRRIELLHTNVMYVAPRGAGHSEGHYDDTVIWATQQELQYILNKKGVLPAPDSPTFRKY